MNQTILTRPAALFATLLAVSIFNPATADDSQTPVAAGECQTELRRCRAGHPDTVAPWARWTYGSKYCGQYTGGGAVLHGRSSFLRGEPRLCDEGTFGMDYAPSYSRVELRWYHGMKYQGGEGQYEPNHHNYPFVHIFRRH